MTPPLPEASGEPLPGAAGLPSRGSRAPASGSTAGVGSSCTRRAHLWGDPCLQGVGGGGSSFSFRQLLLLAGASPELSSCPSQLGTRTLLPAQCSRDPTAPPGTPKGPCASQVVATCQRQEGGTKSCHPISQTASGCPQGPRPPRPLCRIQANPLCLHKASEPRPGCRAKGRCRQGNRRTPHPLRPRTRPPPQEPQSPQGLLSRAQPGPAG